MEGFAFVDGYFQSRDRTCSCGRPHAVPIRTIAVKRGALDELGAIVAKLDIGRRGLMVADGNGYALAGERALRLLAEAGCDMKLCLFDTREPMHADEAALGKVLVDVDPGATTFLIAVGSGTVTDITRLIASRVGLPFVSVATAASMDGYASPVAPLVLGGIKTTLPAAVPIAIVADSDLMVTAPYAMTAAGYGDLLGKYNARVDWRLAKLLTNEYYCRDTEDLVTEAVDACVAGAAKLRLNTPEAVGELTEGLILAGVGMLATGSSRPASGGEHSLGHYWEIMGILKNRPASFHGTMVGVATGIMAKVYRKFFELDPSLFDGAIDARPAETDEAWRERLRAIFGPAAKRLIGIQTPFRLDDTRRRALIGTVRTRWPEILKLRDAAKSYDEVVAALKAAGAPVLPVELGIDGPYLRETLRYAKEVRPQFTVFNVIDALGLLDDFVESIAAEYD